MLGEEIIKIHSLITSRIHSPYDDLIPEVYEPAALFYTDAVRIYFALCCGTTTIEDAYEATENLKCYPEYGRFSLNPLYIPLSKETMNKIISNLETANKYNLASSDSIRAACTFALLLEDAPLTDLDMRVLKHFGKNILDTYTNASQVLGIAPQTVSNSVNRLMQRNGIRFISMMDTTAFGAKRVMVFFALSHGVDWEDVSNGLVSFPFTKAILKTENSPLGYAVFVVPNYKKALPILIKSIRSLKPSIFEYYSIHQEQWAGAHTNLTLLKGQHWEYPKRITKPLENHQFSPVRPPCYVECQEGIDGLSERDFVVANELVLDARGTAATIKESLIRKGWEFDRGRISRSIQKIQRFGLVRPRVHLSGVGLTTNICVEFVCSPSLVDRIVSTFCYAPSSIFFASDKGLIVWLMVPGRQQFDYCKILEIIEAQKEVDSINPIMTIGQRGSRDTLDLVQNWEFKEDGWWIPREQVNLSQHLSQYLTY